MYEVLLTKDAQKDFLKIKAAKLLKKTGLLIDIIRENPFQNPPPYEKLAGDLRGKYSRRINLQHRLVYEVHESQEVIRVLRMWTHYE